MKNFKTMQTCTVILCMFLSMMCSTRAMAQVKVADKEIIGVWVMTSMKYDGENKELIGENYSQVKVYRATVNTHARRYAKTRTARTTYFLMSGELILLSTGSIRRWGVSLAPSVG